MTARYVVTYKREPSEDLRKLLASGGVLHPLLEERCVSGIEIDAHFRPSDEVHLYCSLTRLVSARRNTNGSISLESHKTYAEKPYAEGLFRRNRMKKVDRGEYRRDVWSVDEAGFPEALEAFLRGVKVGERQIREGAVQSHWSRIQNPWTPFDKEAAISYASKRERSEHLAEVFRPSVEVARKELKEIAASQRRLPKRRDHWAMPKSPKERFKLDQIAVDGQGCLVLVEIKDAQGAASEVYYAPFQLLQNVWEWHATLNAVRSSLQRLLDARKELELTPGDVPMIANRIRAAVCFGEDGRSKEVKHRYDKVMGVVSGRLPPGVKAIETWVLKNGEPERLG